MTTLESIAADDFAHLARDYDAFLHDSSGLSLLERLERAAWHLARLYAAALGLPPVTPSDPQGALDPAVIDPPLDFGHLDLYWMVFDPTKPDPDAPVAGSLCDDLLEINHDLQRGLHLFSQSTHQSVTDAVWTWRFDFHTHWGRHTLGALAALHAAITTQQLGQQS
jgi:Domain of unknown function (DUF5063)